MVDTVQTSNDAARASAAMDAVLRKDAAPVERKKPSVEERARSKQQRSRQRQARRANRRRG